MKRILFIALALLVIAPAANAGGFFIGASAMQSGIEVDTEDFDEDDTGFKAFGGYRFGIDLEGFYRLQFSQNLAITPSLQLLIDPAGNPADDEIWVFGVRMRLTL